MNHPMNQRLALAFLVLLRMAIGWHFLVEGYEKYHSIEIGPTETNRPWSSEGFFRNGTGPVAKLFRSAVGDTDDLLLERLTVRGAALPDSLDQDWDRYF